MIDESDDVALMFFNVVSQFPRLLQASGVGLVRVQRMHEFFHVVRFGQTPLVVTVDVQNLSSELIFVSIIPLMSAVDSQSICVRDLSRHIFE